MTCIITVRHGETEWNRERIYRGSRDIPLNDNGRRQAAVTAAALQKRTIDSAYTSPLSRAAETAHLVLEPHGIDAVEDEALSDFDYGEWEGVGQDEVKQRWPAEYEEWTTRPHEARPPGGTSLLEVFDRSFPMMVTVARKHEGGTVALFSHRVVNKLLVLGALGLGLERFPYIMQGNCSYNEFIFEDSEFITETLNCTVHMTEGGVEVLPVDF